MRPVACCLASCLLILSGGNSLIAQESIRTDGTVIAGAFEGDGSGLTDVPVDLPVLQALCDAFARMGTTPPSGLGCPTSSDRIVFVTQGLVTGDAIKGLRRADALCQTEADDANLAGVFKAWLSDETTPVISRFLFDTSLTYKKAEGTIVAQGLDILEGTLLSPIDRDAFGNSVSGVTRVWTGTSAKGTPFAADCLHWTTDRVGLTTYLGVYGLTTSTSDSWTHVNGTACANEFRLYCFQQ